MKQILLFIFSILLFTNTIAQNYTINGYVQDAKTGEKLPYASVIINNTNQGVSANNYGFFSITTSNEKAEIISSYVGYKTIHIHLLNKKDTTLTLLLEPSNELEEVVVTSEQKLTSTRSSLFNVSSISMKDIKKVPLIMGEMDVLKCMQLMPGIKSGQDGTSGLNVRGGSPDQNLILLDGVPVYNANHLFGFLSVFNSDALKSVNAIKGGFPARYGGRLSSIIDVQMKEGNNQNIKGDVSLGLLSSRVTIEGPIIKNKTSFVFSARRAYFDLISALANSSTSESGESYSSGYYFYDINAKINHKISDKSHLFLSVYSGKDKAFSDWKYKMDANVSQTNFNINWRNTTVALRYNYIINKALFANATLIFSKYKFGITNADKNEGINPTTNKVTDSQYNGFTSNSGIQDIGMKYDFDYYLSSNHAIKFGAAYTKHKFTPETSTTEKATEAITTIQRDSTYGTSTLLSDEIAAYIEDDWTITPKLRTNIGLRVANFYVQNKNYPAIEPRLSARYLLNDNLSIKAAYSRMNQYIHLLSNSSSGLPTDLWLPVTKKIKPMNSDQFALGTQYNFSSFEIVAESFYKLMHNLAEYKEGTAYLQNIETWEDKLENGKGNAYGFELMLRKTEGKTTGWIGYTLSWSNRTFENINNGKTFPYRYDKRHDISIVLTHKFSEKFDIGATWVFNTGSPFTLATKKYASADEDNTKMIYYYSDRNAYRMPVYHRMDVGANFYKKKRWGTRIWSISVYNVYNHFNPYYIYVKEKDGKSEIRQYSLLPILPSITYTFKFE